MGTTYAQVPHEPPSLSPLVRVAKMRIMYIMLNYVTCSSAQPQRIVYDPTYPTAQLP